MATAASGPSHLGVTENQKRWLVAGIALNKILIPQIRPFVEQGIKTEYNNLKTSHNIDGQSTSSRLQRWPPRKVLKYENINGNGVHPKLGGRYNYALFDCRVTSHVDFARLYVENYMAKFNAFDDHCDASAVMALLGGVPVFSAAVQTAAGDVKTGRNDWAHCVFSKWDEAKFQQSFLEMEHLVKVMGLPVADEGKLIAELKDWESKGTHLCVNSPVDSVLLQLVQQELKTLQDAVDNMSVEFEEEKTKVQHELQNVARTLKEMEQKVQRLETGQQILETGQQRLETGQQKLETGQQNLETGQQKLETGQQILETGQQNLKYRTGLIEGRVDNLEDRMDFEGDANQRMVKLESRTVLVEDRMDHLGEQMDDLAMSKESISAASYQESPKPAVYPARLVQLIRRDYKGAALCPFPWCEDELQLELSNIFTRLKIISKKKERGRRTGDIVKMTDVFRPHEDCGKPRVVLIEGQPGMGKTTYCQKLAYDWSVNEISPEVSFPEVEMLLLLKCRDMKTADIEEAIDDQLLPLDVDKKEKENFFHFIRCNQSRILLVLDGLDELPHDLFQGLFPLIQGRVFSNTYIMLTARHEAGMEVRRYCDTLLEIVGYTSEDADSYIKKYFSNHEDPSLANKMIKKLVRNSQLRELTANPLNTALLCLVCEDARGKFPSNRTTLYHELVSCALRRYCAKKGVPLDDNDPIEAYAAQLNQLGKLAFEALVKDQLAFSAGEMRGQSTEFIEFGFLSREASASKIKPKSSYAFTHKSIQEYFAAFYLAHELLTGDSEKGTLLAKLSPIEKFWQVWEFLFTMVASKSDDMAVLLVSSLCASFSQERPERLSLGNSALHEEEEEEEEEDDGYERDDDSEDYAYYDDICMYDNDDDDDENNSDDNDDDGFDADICKDACYAWDRDGELVMHAERSMIEYKFLNGTMYLIAQCEQGETELKDFQKKMIRTLARCLPSNKFSTSGYCRFTHVLSEYLKANCRLTHLTWFENLDELALATIEHVLQSSHKLVYLHLCRELRSTSLTPALKANCTLTHLNLRNVRIGIAGAKALGQVLQSNCTLTHLSLPGNNIIHIGAEALAKGLQSNNVLVFLNISCNWIGDRGAVALAQVLESNRTLTYLDVGMWPMMTGYFLRPSSDFDHIDSECIGDSGTSAIAHALRSNSSLTYLDIQGNKFSDSAAAAALGEALQSNSTLTYLYLSGLMMPAQNHISTSGAGALAKALQSSGTQLTCLDLFNTSISSSCAIALAEALQSNCTLTRLDLGGNLIDCSGATALAKALLSNRTLTHLQLKSNNIGDSGATEFAESLQYNGTLTFLDLCRNRIGKLGQEILQRINPLIGCTLRW